MNLRAFFQKAATFFFQTTILLLPTQLGKHFWPDFALTQGIRIDYLSPTLYVTDITIFLSLFFTILYLGNTFLLPFRILLFKHKILLLLISLDIGLGIIGATNKMVSLYELYKDIEFLLFIYLVIRNVPKVKIATLLALGVCFESLLSVAQFVHQGSLGGPLYLLGEREIFPSTPGAANVSIHGLLLLRPYGTFSHPNVLAGYLIVVLALLIFSKKKKQIKNNLGWIITYILGSLGVVISLSRPAVMVLFVMICVRLAMEKGRKRKIYATSIFICLVLLILISFSVLRFRLFDFSLSDSSITQRIYLMQVALKMIGQSPLFGIGLGNFIPTLPRIMGYVGYQLLQPVHNIYLLEMSELGMFGFLLLVWIIYMVIQKLRHVQSNGYQFTFRGIVIALSSIAFLGLFDHYFFTLEQAQLVLCLVIGIVYAEKSRA